MVAEPAAVVVAVSFAVLGVMSTYLGISDWKRREVELRQVLACYGISAACNAAAVVVMAAMAGPPPAVTSSGQIVVADIASSTIVTVLFLSGMVTVFWRLRLLAAGDALAVPAILSMLIFVAEPVEVILYFVAALMFVLAISLAENLRNNLRYRHMAYGPLWHRLYLLFFCRYGDGRQQSTGHSFVYLPGRVGANASSRRDYDKEPFYEGNEKTWLVPGLPLLSGFAPATPVLALLKMVF